MRSVLRTGRHCVSILWLADEVSLTCILYLSVAARQLFWADPSLGYTVPAAGGSPGRNKVVCRLLKQVRLLFPFCPDHGWRPNAVCTRLVLIEAKASRQSFSVVSMVRHRDTRGEGHQWGTAAHVAVAEPTTESTLPAPQPSPQTEQFPHQPKPLLYVPPSPNRAIALREPYRLAGW